MMKNSTDLLGFISDPYWQEEVTEEDVCNFLYNEKDAMLNRIKEYLSDEEEGAKDA